MNQLLKEIEQKYLQPDRNFSVGDHVRVHLEIAEGGKKRIQIFEGDVIKREGAGTNATVTIRKMSEGIGVEKIVPIHLPGLKKVEIMRNASVRRAKLYYLRGAVGQDAKLKEASESAATSSRTAKAANLAKASTN